MVIDGTSGNVGIGTSSPQTTLDVKGTFAISNSTTSYWDFDRDDSDGSLKIADTGTERMRIASDGTLSTTTSGTNNLRLGSGAGASIASGGNENTVAGDGSGAALSTGDQNVGVGHNRSRGVDHW